MSIDTAPAAAVRAPRAMTGWRLVFDLFKLRIGIDIAARGQINTDDFQGIRHDGAVVLRAAACHIRACHAALLHGGGPDAVEHAPVLDEIARLVLVEIPEPDAALEAVADLVDLVLEPAQGLGDAFVDDLLAPAHTNLAAHDATAVDRTTCHGRPLDELYRIALMFSWCSSSDAIAGT